MVAAELQLWCRKQVESTLTLSQVCVSVLSMNHPQSLSDVVSFFMDNCDTTF